MSSAPMSLVRGWLPAVLAAAVAAGCSPPPPVAAPAAKPAASDHDHAHGHDHDHDHAKADPKADAAGSEHDDHEHPLTLAAGLDELEKLTTDLTEKLGDDAGEAADDAVHGIAHLLEDLRGLARKELAEGEVATAATKALDELEECFSKVDEAFHTSDDKADPPSKVLESVTERVKAAVKVLKEAVR